VSQGEPIFSLISRSVIYEYFHRSQAIEGDVADSEALAADAPMLQAKMKDRHLKMIAVGSYLHAHIFALLIWQTPSGGSIGTGLFVGSGSALHVGGPAALIICWILIGVMMINVTQALGEMAILYPVSGGFYTLANRFLDPSFAFAMGWNYLFQWVIVLPLEITVAGTTVGYWTDKVNLGVWITVFWVVICGLPSYFHTWVRESDHPSSDCQYIRYPWLC
jgi:yeast amino acid transporter